MKGIKADTKKGEVTLEINTKFYSKENVLEAADAFRQSCWVYADGSEETIFIKLKPKKEIAKRELEDLGGEFYNFVLGIAKNK